MHKEDIIVKSKRIIIKLNKIFLFDNAYLSIQRKSDSKDGDLLAKSEQRVKELRKRNGELVNLARRLEEKAKRFQEELKEVVC